MFSCCYPTQKWLHVTHPSCRQFITPHSPFLLSHYSKWIRALFGVLKKAGLCHRHHLEYVGDILMQSGVIISVFGLSTRSDATLTSWSLKVIRTIIFTTHPEYFSQCQVRHHPSHTFICPCSRTDIGSWLVLLLEWMVQKLSRAYRDLVRFQALLQIPRWVFHLGGHTWVRLRAIVYGMDIWLK